MSAHRTATTQDPANSMRELELQAFRHVNALLDAATDFRGRAVALERTYRLWGVLIRDLASPDNRLPADLRGRLVSLGLWAQRECDARLEGRQSLAPLIELHHDMIAGLEGQAANRPPPRDAAAA